MKRQRINRIALGVILLLVSGLCAWTCDPQPSEPLCIGDWECGHDEYCNAMSICDRNDVDFQTLYKAAKAGFDERSLIVVKSAQEWVDFLPLLNYYSNTAIELPEIDFSKNMMVVLTTGLRNSSGFNLNVSKITRHSEGITIHFTEYQPGHDCPVTKNQTNPYVILLTERIEGEITMDADVITYTCQ